MSTYKTEYYTLSKGKDPNGEPGKLRQFTDIAYIQCSEISKAQGMLEKYFELPRFDIFYQPVITRITEVKGHCIVESQTAQERQDNE